MRRRLETQEDVRRLLAFVVREVEADKMSIPKAKALIYAGMSLSAVLSDHDLERRVAVLEEAPITGRKR